MQSLESGALEPTRSELAKLSIGERVFRFLPVYGLVILTVMLIALFSVLLPDTFPTMLNLRAIISDKATVAMLALGAMIPMAAGRIDLTVGYGIVLWHILAISLQTLYGFPWPIAVLVVLFLGAFSGFLNGLLVEVAKIDSFIATLGTGTVLYALALWHTGGRQMVGVLPEEFYALNSTFVFGLPITGYYLLAITIIMWIALEYTPCCQPWSARSWAPPLSSRAGSMCGAPSWVSPFWPWAFPASNNSAAPSGLSRCSMG